MRLYVKRSIAGGCVLVCLWVLLTYFLTYRELIVPPTGISVEEMELKLDNLKQRMDMQFQESNSLLERLKGLDKNKKAVPIGLSKKKEEEEYKEVEYEQGPPSSNPVLPILVIACDRVTVKRCLDKLIKNRPNKETFPIIVSQDCGHGPTKLVIESFTRRDPSITLVQQPDLSEIVVPKPSVRFKGYYKIARHYRFALNHVFKTLGHEAVIIVEDDLDISPDFFEYFLGTYPLLLKDPSIWCVSAWNDNGKEELIESARPELLHRTDFFPGLGWMLRRGRWLALEPHWPPAFFDDWLRNPENTEGRACIRPEISRTYSFGRIGVSKGLYFDNHLRHMQLNQKFVEFTKLNLTYLVKENYDEPFKAVVYSAPAVTAEEALHPSEDNEPVRVPYSDAKTYRKAAKRLGLMDDFRCVAFDELEAPQAPVHFLVVPRRVLPRLSDATDHDEKILGHLLVVAHTLAQQRGLLRGGYHALVEEDWRAARLNTLHVFGRALHHMLWPTGPGAKL